MNLPLDHAPRPIPDYPLTPDLILVQDKKEGYDFFCPPQSCIQINMKKKTNLNKLTYSTFCLTERRLYYYFTN